MKQTAKILLVDDEPGMLRYIKTLLEVDDYKVETATTGEEALAEGRQGPATGSGFARRADARHRRLADPGTTSAETAGHESGHAVVRQRHAKSRAGDEAGRARLSHQAVSEGGTGCGHRSEPGTGQTGHRGEVEELADDVFFIAASPAMRKIRSQAALVANVDIPVLLLGESGTGKEVLARLIHKLSPRAHRTFLKVNCAAVPAICWRANCSDTSRERSPARPTPSRASSSSATRARSCSTKSARCRRCLQAKLLHVLQDQQFSRLGSRSVIKVDVRILAATNINIPEALATKRLREDLYYRLNAFTLQPAAAARSQGRNSDSAEALHDAHGGALRARRRCRFLPSCCRPARITPGPAICAS